VASAGQLLLTLHTRIGRWLQTGGHLESTDADLEAAAVREAQEESGLAPLELDPEPLLLSQHEVPCGPVRPTYHLDVQFLLQTPSTDTPTFGAESHDVRWFRIDALPAVDQSVRDLVAAAASRLGWGPQPSRTGTP
jgi:8-oxo-dGTP pyrophosphatase MutT (NUDIX family)